MDSLHAHAARGRVEEVERLLSNARFSPGELTNALAAAAFGEHVRIVSILLAHGADPNAQPENHMPALYGAIEQQNPEIVRILAAGGANLNLRIEGGSTPLHLAVDIEGDSAYQAGRVPRADLTALLLNLGADPNLMDSNGKRPIDLAREYDHAVAFALLEGQPANPS